MTAFLNYKLFNLGEEISRSILFVGLALIFIIITHLAIRILRGLAKKRPDKSEMQIINVLEIPLYWAIFLTGLYFGLINLSTLTPYANNINTVFKAFLTIWILFVLTKTIGIFLAWYRRQLQIKHNYEQDPQLVSLIDRLIYIAIWIIAILVLLHQFGYKITTLVASLGLGGLAVALELLDALRKLFLVPGEEMRLTFQMFRSSPAFG